MIDENINETEYSSLKLIVQLVQSINHMAVQCDVCKQWEAL